MELSQPLSQIRQRVDQLIDLYGADQPASVATILGSVAATIAPARDRPPAVALPDAPGFETILEPGSVDDSRAFWARFFCGCGNPRAAIEAFRGIMDIFQQDENGSAVWDDRIEKLRDELGEGLFYLIMYWLEGMDLIEHGTSVNCAWLTELGETVQEQLQTCQLPGDFLPEEDD